MAADMRINQASMESIMRALTQALSDDPEVLDVLRDLIIVELPKSGLGYIGTDLLRGVEAKMESETAK